MRNDTKELEEKRGQFGSFERTTLFRKQLERYEMVTFLETKGNLRDNNIIQSFRMKGKKYKKRQEEAPPLTNPSRTEPPPFFKFNLTQDSIACFIGDKKSGKKRTRKTSNSVRKSKGVIPQDIIKTEQPGSSRNKCASSIVMKQTQSEQIVQGSLNTILAEIESKGVTLAWSDGDDFSGCDQKYQNQSDLWSIFSVTSVTESREKSPASTMDVRQNTVFFAQEPYTYQSFQYSYSMRPYQEGSLYQLREDAILQDPRTTVMIRNIPNKYTIKELSEQIDQYLANTYDFLYLPCDSKNQCNVGYGFINFLSTEYLSEFYNLFQSRRWYKFRSEKICNLTYARLQGLDNLIDHFENSKVLNQKEKKYRPIIREFNKIGDLIRTQQNN